MALVAFNGKGSGDLATFSFKARDQRERLMSCSEWGWGASPDLCQLESLWSGAEEERVLEFQLPTPWSCSGSAGWMSGPIPGGGVRLCGGL